MAPSTLPRDPHPSEWVAEVYDKDWNLLNVKEETVGNTQNGGIHGPWRRYVQPLRDRYPNQKHILILHKLSDTYYSVDTERPTDPPPPPQPYLFPIK